MALCLMLFSPCTPTTQSSLALVLLQPHISRNGDTAGRLLPACASPPPCLLLMLTLLEVLNVRRGRPRTLYDMCLCIVIRRNFRTHVIHLNINRYECPEAHITGRLLSPEKKKLLRYMSSYKYISSVFSYNNRSNSKKNKTKKYIHYKIRDILRRELTAVYFICVLTK